MATLNEVNVALSEATNFYNEKKELITKAYDCCMANPCSMVNSSLEGIESKLKGELSKADGWMDKAGTSFKIGINVCLANLEAIKSSIASAWNNGETLYKNNYNNLTSLEKAIKSLEVQRGCYPNRDDRKYKDEHYNPETKRYESHFNSSKYHQDVLSWESKSGSLINVVNNLINSITQNIASLNAINGSLINVSSNVKLISDYSAKISPNYKGLPISYLGEELSVQQLTNMCIAEQGATIEGVQFEMSQVINLFIERRKREPSSASELSNFMLTLKGSDGYYYAKRTRNMANNSRPDQTFISAVEEVLDGNRVLPVNVTSHDYFGDIKKIELNGQIFTDQASIKNKNYYIPDVTVITNKMGEKYTFYAFAPDVDGERGDPFGYMEKI